MKKTDNYLTNIEKRIKKEDFLRKIKPIAIVSTWVFSLATLITIFVLI